MAKPKIPRRLLDLFQKRTFAHLATLMPDGSPHVSPVWVGYDGAHLIVNSVRGRVILDRAGACGRLAAKGRHGDGGTRGHGEQWVVDGGTRG